MHVTNDDKKEALDAFKTAIKTTEGKCNLIFILMRENKVVSMEN